VWGISGISGAKDFELSAFEIWREEDTAGLEEIELGVFDFWPASRRGYVR
jgi:hypothetical protein